MNLREKLRDSGTKVYVQLGNNDAEFPYYFPRVPSIGEHVRILDSDGQKRHVREIRALKGTLTQKQLGERYGVDRSAISRIHRGLMGVVVKDYTTPSQTASEGKVK